MTKREEKLSKQMDECTHLLRFRTIEALSLPSATVEGDGSYSSKSLTLLEQGRTYALKMVTRTVDGKYDVAYTATVSRDAVRLHMVFRDIEASVEIWWGKKKIYDSTDGLPNRKLGELLIGKITSFCGNLTSWIGKQMSADKPFDPDTLRQDGLDQDELETLGQI